MKKAALVLPYFGRLPNYFELFLKTVGENKDFHLQLFTDDHTPLSYPGNVIVHYCGFDDVVALVKSKIDEKVCIPDGHKLCDFKPAYGLIFEEYLHEYDYWAYCDCDVLLGDLSKFCAPLFDEDFDKIFTLGHMTFIRNTPENNRLFMAELDGEPIYRQALFQAPTFWLDEAYKSDRKDINSLFLKAGKRVFTEDYSLNPIIETMYFHQCVLNFADYRYETIKEPPFYVVWDHGKIKKITRRNGRPHEEEFCYLHLQRRKMQYDRSLLDAGVIRIVPDAFLADGRIPTPNCFNTTSRSGLDHFLRHEHAMLVRKLRKLRGR